MPLTEILPPLAVGATFTAFGLAKVYGLVKGIATGRKGTTAQYICSS